MISAARLFRACGRFVTSAPYRRVLVLRTFGAEGAFQPFNTTAANRYPVIFSFVQQELGATSDLRLLSFGCSTGEEVWTLRDYFTHAAIKGIDINPANIAVCRNRLAENPDAALSFSAGSSTAAEPDETYDAIFCMAVLRDGRLGTRQLSRCEKYLDFADFARSIADFRRCLKIGGLLVVRHANFRVSDTPAAAGLAAILDAALPERQISPVYGADNCLLPGVRNTECVFRRVD